MNEIVGKCSKCGGDVVVPKHWMGIYTPVPLCMKCGAIKKNHLPIIKME